MLLDIKIGTTLRLLMLKWNKGDFMTIHLHARSSYSLLSSTLTVKQLVQKEKDLDFSAIALTDKNVMHGAFEFYKMCQNYAIKPIFGLEIDCEIKEVIYPFLLLAKNNDGYKNLMKCSSLICSSKLSITLEELSRYAENNIVVAYGEGGIFESSLINEDKKECSAQIDVLKDVFNEFYIAISMNDASFWKIKNTMLKECAKKSGIKTISLSKIMYCNEEDANLYKVVSGIRLSKTINDRSLPTLQGRYIRSNQEMDQLYDAEDNEMTEVIAKQCNVDFTYEKTSLPKFITPNGINSKNYLTQLCVAGLKKRLSNQSISSSYTQRLKYELNVITTMNFEDYFLIVWDFIRFARKSGIYIGPGRGSAAGSLVAYCLGITHVDPIQYNLLFERFLNPERISMPDIDTDFPDDRRDEVIQYVYEKYGKEHAARIITFGTLGAKQVLRDVGRVLEIPLREVDMICKAVPFSPKMTLQRALKESQHFKQMIEADTRYTNMLQIALKLEGLPRHASTHAAGVVLSALPLNDVIPTIQIEQDMVSTQFTMEYLEELGLIKMDFLGLRNLTTIDDIVKMVQVNDPNFNIYQISMTDKKTYDLIKKVDTVGVFQLESDGMKNLIRQMNPYQFNDIVATIALFRPGPMENIPLYLKARENSNNVHYIHPDLENILKDTYGVMIYQEQIMQTAQIMAGFTLGKADILRKAMSKKKEKDLKLLEKDFIDGCLSKGHSHELAHQLFDLVLKFAGYGFNKAHSVAYGLIAYQLAYLKANYPYEFYCALLNSVVGSDSKTAEYMDECRRRSINVLPPSINKSAASYLLSDEGIRFPLLAIKNIGFSAIQEILSERSLGEFTDYYDFVARIMVRKVNKKMIECLIDAGALDEFQMNRRSMRASLDEAISYADLVRIEIDGQTRIDLGLVSKPIMISVKEDQVEKSEREKEVLGFYLGSHPIIQIKKKYDINVEPLVKVRKQVGYVKGFCCVQKVKQHRTKKGDLMAFVLGVDETSEMDLVIMPNIYQKMMPLLIKGNYLYFDGKMDNKESCLVKSVQCLNREE